jgi:hypothetical protein
MPALYDEWIICKDWNSRTCNTQNIWTILDIEPDPVTLYYHDGEKVQKFGNMNALQNPFIFANVYNDSELGWIIQIDKVWQHLFPSPGFEIEVENITGRFRMMELLRKYPRKHRQTLYCVGAKHSIGNWLNQHMDWKWFENDDKQKQIRGISLQEVPSYGFFIFIEVLVEGRRYKLHPNKLRYKEYLRLK